jgi:hypothetical protein
MKLFGKIPCPCIWEYDDSSLTRFKMHDMFFHLDSRWQIVDDIEEADIIPLLPPTDTQNLLNSKIRIRDDQYGWICHFYAIDDHMDNVYYQNLLKFYNHIGKNIVLAHKNLAQKDSIYDNIFYYDSMFDICKLYFTEYTEELNDKVWNRLSEPDFFNLPEICVNPTKKFIYAAYVYPPFHHPRMRYRSRLGEFLKSKYIDDGYVGEKGQRLLPNNIRDDSQCLKFINHGPIMWYPIADDYYHDTFISIIVETIMGLVSNSEDPKQIKTDVKCITEKVFEPLAKGNFILPFGYKGIVDDIRSYGFKLPDWIDYSYDDILDPDDRFESYLCSVDDILNMRMNKVLNRYYINDVEILEHNRQVFFDRPYDDLYGKLKNIVDNWPR